MNKPPLIIYHKDCADGFGAAWCFWDHDKFRDKAEYHPGVYNDPPPDCAGRDVYLVDFSYKREVVEQMLAVANKVVFLDHHKTAIDDLVVLTDRCSDSYMPNFEWHADITRSGAMIAWDYLHNSMIHAPDRSHYQAPPLLLEHIQDRDLWKFKLPHTKEITAYLFSHEYTFELWDILMRADAVELMKFTAAGAAIQRKHIKDVQTTVEMTSRPMNIRGYVVEVACLPPHMASDGGAYMNTSTDLFSASYYDTLFHRVFSLRSSERGLDVSKIAAYYNGGGHKHAAGFKVPRDHPLAKA